MSFDRVMPQLWIILPREERDVLIQEFSLVRTGVTEVRDSTVVSDGYSYDDLAAITAEKMAEFVAPNEVEEAMKDSFPRLWELTVAKARSIVNPPIAEIVSENGEMVADELPPAPTIEEDPKIKAQEEQLQQYEKSDVTLETVVEEPGHDFNEPPAPEFTDKTSKNAKTNKSK
jgi:hypothetical protein